MRTGNCVKIVIQIFKHGSGGGLTLPGSATPAASKLTAFYKSFLILCHYMQNHGLKPFIYKFPEKLPEQNQNWAERKNWLILFTLKITR
ncbi:MAG: hypothetical protein RI981_504 [Bacteroidota bacterium]|jgi:hypothetical protein